MTDTTLVNAIQRAQRLVAEGKLQEADEVLTHVINYVLRGQGR